MTASSQDCFSRTEQDHSSLSMRKPQYFTAATRNKLVRGQRNCIGHTTDIQRFSAIGQETVAAYVKEEGSLSDLEGGTGRREKLALPYNELYCHAPLVSYDQEDEVDR